MEDKESGELLTAELARDAAQSAEHDTQPINMAELMKLVYQSDVVARSSLERAERFLRESPCQPTSSMVFPQQIPLNVKPENPPFKGAAAHFTFDPMHKICAPDGLTLSFWMCADKQVSQGTHQVINFGTSKILIGSELKIISILNADFESDNDSFYVAFGSVSDTDFDPSYQISNIFGFKGVLSSDCAVLLKALGCTKMSLTFCTLNRTEFSFLNCVAPSLIQAKPDLQKLFADPKTFIEKLQRSLLFTIYADRPHAYSLSVLQKGMQMDKLNAGLTFLLTTTQEIALSWQCFMATGSPDEYGDSITSMGHVKVFLFAYALAVDRNYTAETQAQALKVLTTHLKRDVSAFTTFCDMNGPAILTRILQSGLASNSAEVFSVLYNFIFSRLEIDADGDIRASPYSVVAEPKLLLILTSSVSLWEKSFTNWVTLIRLLHQTLCSDKCGKRLKAFNLSQLTNVNFIGTLLNTLLEMMMSPAAYQSTDVDYTVLTTQLTDIIKQLLENPYNCKQVQSLWHFIQLSHAAPDLMIEKTIYARNSWIDTDLIMPKPESFPKPSELGELLKQMGAEHSKDEIENLWASTTSLLEIRKAFLNSHEVDRQLNQCCLHEDEDIPSVDGDGFEAPQEHWLIHVRSQALSLIGDVLLTCQDGLMACLEEDVISWPAILVLLSNQKNEEIRTRTIVIIKNFLIRCNPKYKKHFVEHSGFVFLANEIVKTRINFQIIDAIFSLAFMEHVTVQNGLDSDHLADYRYNTFQSSFFYCLLACLEKSVTDQTLFWNVCSGIEKMYHLSPTARMSFLEHGLIHSMANVLISLAAMEDGVKNINGPVFPVMDIWMELARVVVQKSVPYRNHRAEKHCEELVHLCFVAEIQANNKAMNEKANFRPITIRRMLCHILITWIDSIKSVLCDPVNACNFRSVTNASFSDDSSDFEVVPSDSDFGSTYNLLSMRARRSQQDFCAIEEFAQRLCFAFQMATNLFLLTLPTAQPFDEDDHLFKLLVNMVFPPKFKTQDDWSKCLELCRESNKILLTDLIAFLIFDAQSKVLEQDVPYHQQSQLQKRVALTTMLDENLQRNRSYVQQILQDYEYALKIGLHEIGLLPRLTCNIESNEVYTNIASILKFLRASQVDSPLSNLSDDEIKGIDGDEGFIVQAYRKKEAGFCTSLQNLGMNIVKKEERFLKFKAHYLTCDLAEKQGGPRKAAMLHKKNVHAEIAKASETLSTCVRELCHPQAVFHDPASWPKGWALDATENYKRERRRLKPSHYQFPSKFLRAGKREEVEKDADSPAPLDRLLQGSLGRTLIERVEAHNQVRQSLSAVLVRTVFECTGEVVVSDKKLYFLGEVAKSTQVTKAQVYAPVNYSWSFEQIREIQSRFYLLKDTALELFTTTGDAFLVVFQTVEQRDMLLNQLRSMDMVTVIVDPGSQLGSATKMWRNGLITNFDYLIIINKLAGRSFNDLMQYPVFPFVLCDYTSALLDLTAAQSYRDLSRPMAIQDRKMEAIYTQNYQSLLEEYRKQSADPLFPSAHFGAYHYGSHYSNTGIVAHYMVRVLPYTNVALEYQDNNFDVPDRLFNTLETTWRLSSSESTTDFKELIPEFFFFPEMFQNRENLELGVRQAGQQVHNVNLPPWVPRGNPRLFCLIHRQALESSHVTLALHNWVDLIFGYKQNGDAAIRAVNVFHPATYRGRDLEVESAGDEVYVSAVRTMIRTYGQMPVQLFVSPHLPHLEGRAQFSTVENQLLPSVRGLRWGDFVGSPETDDRLCSAPCCIFKLEAFERIDHLTALHNDGSQVCYGMPTATALIAKYKSDKSDVLRRTMHLSMTAVLSWRFSDRILRIKPVQLDDSVWVNLLDLQSLKVAQLVFSPSSDLMYIGFTNGLIRVYCLLFNQTTKLWSCTQRGELFAHLSPITSLSIADNFHVVLSTSEDANICLWDTNRLEFIRNLDSTPKVAGLKETVTLSCISHINADIAVVFESEYGSRVSVCTVNGDVIGCHNEEVTIMSLAMTSLDEGIGINCLALGLQNGVIRLLEMWTLSTVRLISCQNINAPVISLQFTRDSRRIYAALSNSHVLCWQVNSLSKNKPPSFQMLNPFL